LGVASALMHHPIAALRQAPARRIPHGGSGRSLIRDGRNENGSSVESPLSVPPAIDAKKLRSAFRAALDRGVAVADAAVANALYNNAVHSNNVAAQIWWSKARMRWKRSGIRCWMNMDRTGNAPPSSPAHGLNTASRWPFSTIPHGGNGE